MLDALDGQREEIRDRVTQRDLHQRIKELGGTSNRKLQEYWAVVDTRLSGMLSKLGKTVDGRETFDVEKLLDKPVVIELDGLDRQDANFLVLWLFYWNYTYRRPHQQRGSLPHVLIIDEAMRVFTGSEMYSSTTSDYSGVPPADLFCDEIRDFGEAIIAADQEPTKLSQSLKANTYTKLTGNLGNGLDIVDISGAMGLKEEEKDAVSALDRGEWIVKLSGRHTKPFMLKTEDFPVTRDVTDKRIAELMKDRISSIRIRKQ